jgi:hypothetical protein
MSAARTTGDKFMRLPGQLTKAAIHSAIADAQLFEQLVETRGLAAAENAFEITRTAVLERLQRLDGLLAELEARPRP